MAGTARLSQDHMTALCALEVLSLITDRLEQYGNADGNDIDMVLRFFRNIAHPCLDNTERWLLRPFLEAGINPAEQDRLGAAVACHRQVKGLLDELENCYRQRRIQEFVSKARRYAALFGDLIFDEERFIAALLSPRARHDGVEQILARFDQAEDSVALQARSAAPTLRRLEAKYVNPHCI